MYLRTLGGLKLQGADFHRPKPLLLLTYLSVEGAKDRRYLAELFWPGASNHMGSLRKALSQLRGVAPDLVQVHETKLQTNLASDTGDLLEKLASGDVKGAVDAYESPFLETFYLAECGEELEAWIFATRTYLAEQVQRAALGLAEQTLEDDLAQATSYAERAFWAFREAEPDILKRLYPLLRAGESPVAKQVREEAQGYGLSLPDPLPVARTRPAAPAKRNLPTRATSYVGRAWELGELGTMLTGETCRLITVIGMGGVGKTRLALRAAQLHAARFNDGVYFVALEALNDAERIPEKISEALGLELRGQASALEQIKQYLADKAALLVLDNFEHLIAGSALISQLLRACPGLCCLVTSRETLHLEEEWTFDLQGMLYPGTSNLSAEQLLSYDAVALFVERAVKTHRRFERSRETLIQVVALCHVLQGSPLALEMAASWTRLMPVRDIVQELQTSLQSLGYPSRNVPPRHQSIRATFDYSWSLLTASEQATLAKLAVFKGGFTRTAAQRIADLTIPHLSSLVDKSLLRSSSSARLDMHPLIHAFCLDKSRAYELGSTKEGHATYFQDLVREAEPHFRDEQQARWLDSVASEHENITTSLAFWQQTRPEQGLALSVMLSTYWEIRGYYGVAAEWLRTFLDLTPGADRGLRAKATTVMGRITFSQGAYSEAKRFLTSGLDLAKQAGEADTLALALHILGTVSIFQGRYDDAERYLDESKDVKEKSGDQAGLAQTYNHLGLIASFRGAFATAIRHYETSLDLFRQFGRQREIGSTLNNLGLAATYLGQYDVAEQRLKESFVIKQQLGDQRGLASAHLNLGILAKDLNRYDEAKNELVEGLSLFRELGDRHNVAVTLDNLAKVVCHQTHYQEAKVYFQESVALKQSLEDRRGLAEALTDIALLLGRLGAFGTSTTLHAASAKALTHLGVVLDPHSQREVDQSKEQALAHLGQPSFDADWEHGKTLSLAGAVDLAQATLGSIST